MGKAHAFWLTCFPQNTMGFSLIHLRPLRSSHWAGSPGPGCLQRYTVTWQVAERSPKHRWESTYFGAAFVVIVCVSLIKGLAPSSTKQQHGRAADGRGSTHTCGLHSTWPSDLLLPKLTLTEDSSTVIHVECYLTKPAWGHKRETEKKKKQKNKSGRGGGHCYWATSHCWEIGFHPPGTSGSSKEHIDAVPLPGCEGAGLSTLITRLLEPRSASSLAFCQVLVDRLMRSGHWWSEGVLSSKVWVLSVVREEVPWAEKQELRSVCCPGNRGHAKHIYSSYLNFYYEVTFGVLLQLIGHRKDVCRICCICICTCCICPRSVFSLCFPWEIHLVSFRGYGPHLLSFPAPLFSYPFITTGRDHVFLV